MGQEIVYCAKCANRLVSNDFEKGKAFKVGDKSFCSACAKDVLAALPESEREAILAGPPKDPRRTSSPTLAALRPPDSLPSETPRGGTRLTTDSSTRIKTTVRRVAPKSRAGLYVTIGAGIAIVLAILIVASASRHPAPANNPPSTGTSTDSDTNPAPPPLDPIRPPAPRPVTTAEREAAARKNLHEARDFAREKPGDLAGQLERFKKARWEADGTPLLAEAQKELDQIQKKIVDGLAAEIAPIEELARGACGREEFKQAIDTLEQARPRFPVPEWSALLDAKIQQVRADAQKAYAPLREEALAARRSGAEDKAKAISERVAKWGLPVLMEDLARVLSEKPSVSPLPPALPAAPSAFRARWEAAMFLAGGREYAGALEALGKAASAAPGDPLEDGLTADVEVLKKVEKLTAEALQTLSSWPVGKELELTYRNEAGELKRVKGLLVNREPFRIEIKEKDSFYSVNVGEITAAGLAGLLLNQHKAGSSAESRLALGVLCLLDGDIEAADAMLSKGDPPIPGRFRAWAKEAMADSTGRARGEDAARRLFARAESEYPRYEGAAGAVLKYRALLKDHAEAQFVMRNRGLLSRRAEGAREFFFIGEDLSGAGSFQPAARPGGDSVWESKSDTEAARRKENYVELGFSVLPETAYRGWVYVGGCCAETLAFHVQGTDLVGSPAAGAGEVPLPPGGEASAPLEQKILTAIKKHSDHGGTKRPSRWGWVPIPLPAYTNAGPKKIRLLTNQQGFAVGYALVSTLKDGPPSEADLKRMVTERVRVLEAEGLNRLRNLDPTLVVYLPFDEGKGVTAFNAARGHDRASLENGPAWAAGKMGKALRFDGKGAYVKLPASPSSREVNRDITVAAWIYIEEYGGNRCVVSRSLEDCYYMMCINHKTLEVWLPSGGGRIWYKGGGVPVGQWVHVAFACDSQRLRSYVNGGCSGTYDGIQIKSPREGTLVVGADCFGGKPGFPFKGLIDDVRIYNRALSDAEVAALAAGRGNP